MEDRELFQPQLETIVKCYEILTHYPEPEEEEDVHDQFIRLFSEMQEKISQDSAMYEPVSELLKYSKAWDPLESWFTELEDLPKALKKFLQSYFPQRFQEATQQTNNETKNMGSNSMELSENEEKTENMIEGSSQSVFSVQSPLVADSLTPNVSNSEIVKTEDLATGNASIPDVPSAEITVESFKRIPMKQDLEMFEDDDLDDKTRDRIARRLEKIESKMANLFQNNSHPLPDPIPSPPSPPSPSSPPSVIDLKDPTPNKPAGSLGGLKNQPIAFRPHKSAQSMSYSSIGSDDEFSKKNSIQENLLAPKVILPQSQENLDFNSLKNSVESQINSKEESQSPIPLMGLRIEQLEVNTDVANDSNFNVEIEEIDDFDPYNGFKKDGISKTPSRPKN